MELPANRFEGSSQPLGKKQAVDGASLEASGSTLGTLGEALRTESWTPGPAVRAAWIEYPGYWLLRTLVGGGTAMGAIYLTFFVPRPGNTPASLVLTFFMLAGILWFPLSMAAVLDSLREGRALSLADQWRRWRFRVPRLLGVLALHGVAALGAFLGGAFLIGAIGKVVGAELLWTFPSNFFLACAVAMVFFNWFHACSEALLTEKNAWQATTQVLRLRLADPLGTGLAARRRPTTTRSFLFGEVGRAALLPILAGGFFLSRVVPSIVLGMTMFLGSMVGGGFWKASLLLGSIASTGATCLILDWVTAHYGGHYLVYLADRYADGETITLAIPSESTGRVALPGKSP